VCVCVCERERERERVCVYVCICVDISRHMTICVNIHTAACLYMHMEQVLSDIEPSDVCYMYVSIGAQL
jgi:hypothetical protein